MPEPLEVASPPPLHSPYTNGNGISEHTNGTDQPPLPFDTSVFRAYLLALLPPVIGALKQDLEDTLFDAEFDEKVAKFAAEGGDVVYIVKIQDTLEGACPSCLCMLDFV